MCIHTYINCRVIFVVSMRFQGSLFLHWADNKAAPYALLNFAMGTVVVLWDGLHLLLREHSLQGVNDTYVGGGPHTKRGLEIVSIQTTVDWEPYFYLLRQSATETGTHQLARLVGPWLSTTFLSTLLSTGVTDACSHTWGFMGAGYHILNLAWRFSLATELPPQPHIYHLKF